MGLHHAVHERETDAPARHAGAVLRSFERFEDPGLIFGAQRYFRSSALDLAGLSIGFPGVYCASISTSDSFSGSTRTDTDVPGTSAWATPADISIFVVAS